MKSFKQFFKTTIGMRDPGENAAAKTAGEDLATPDVVVGNKKDIDVSVAKPDVNPITVAP